jgi:hypothetical protein
VNGLGEFALEEALEVENIDDVGKVVWLGEGARHVGEGGLRRRGMYFATVEAATSIPTFASSFRMRGAPQITFACAILRIRLTTSRSSPGRPRRPGRLLRLQNLLNPSRCHRITVAGSTIARASLQSFHPCESITQTVPAEHAAAQGVSAGWTSRQAQVGIERKRFRISLLEPRVRVSLARHADLCRREIDPDRSGPALRGGPSNVACARPSRILEMIDRSAPSDPPCRAPRTATGTCSHAAMFTSRRKGTR